jgi:hypothetical protein
MLYFGICKLCGFVVHSLDVTAFKQKIADHFDKSHKLDYGCFVADIPLREFEDVRIIRIRNPVDIRSMLQAVKNPRFWHSFRNHERLAQAMC